MIDVAYRDLHPLSQLPRSLHWAGWREKCKFNYCCKWFNHLCCCFACQSPLFRRPCALLGTEAVRLRCVKPVWICVFVCAYWCHTWVLKRENERQQLACRHSELIEHAPMEASMVCIRMVLMDQHGQHFLIYYFLLVKRSIYNKIYDIDL